MGSRSWLTPEMMQTSSSVFTDEKTSQREFELNVAASATGDWTGSTPACSIGGDGLAE